MPAQAAALTYNFSNDDKTLTKAAGSPLLLYETLCEPGVSGIARPVPLSVD
ncbi:hypothetical protein [Nostoc sp. NZL]|uniref:hypothetical protein n=1 Tax=Nostoc sp. NZL TaxID=2650612 RepID=UPI0018C6007F|nr:hypothetical protein [Nostoc sp. NZL]